MKLKKVIAVAGVCAMVTGMIAGCGNNSSDTSSDSSSDSKTEASSDWDASNDISVVSREDGSGTRGAFIELFGIEEKNGDEKVDNTTDEAQITNSTSVMLTTVAGDDYAIGYVSLGALDDSVKAVVAENGYISDDNAEPFSGSNPSGKIVVGGSSSVSPLMEKLIEAYKENNPDAEIELQTTDSTTGMTSAIDGTYDIGMASRELKDTELSEGLKAQVIATDGIAVIVNKNSTIDELSSDQVKSIYTGETLTWDEVAK